MPKKDGTITEEEAAALQAGLDKAMEDIGARLPLTTQLNRGTPVDRVALRNLIAEFQAHKDRAARHAQPNDGEVAAWQEAIDLAQILLRS